MTQGDAASRQSVIFAVLSAASIVALTATPGSGSERLPPPGPQSIDTRTLEGLASVVRETIVSRLGHLTGEEGETESQPLGADGKEAQEFRVGTTVLQSEIAFEPQLESTRRKSAENHLLFTSSSTNVEVDSWEIDDRTLLVEMIETTRLRYKPKGSVPDPDIWFRQPHVAEYRQHGGSWELVSLNSVGDNALDSPAAPAELAVLDEMSARFDNVVSSEDAAGLGSAERVLPAPIAASGTYSRSAAANYAQTWALSNNPAYVQFGNDCMNFTSQALAAGGWVGVGGTGSGLGRDDTSQWYYDGSISAYSWSVSSSWSVFAANRGRAQTTTDSGMQTGDVVQFDWATPDGHIDHTMMMTSRNSYGQILLAGHTNARRDYPLYSVQSTSPGLRTYFRHIVATN